MGGNYLPPLTETDQLSNLQMSGCVSLALPNTGSPATQRHKMWADVATDFSSKAYNPVAATTKVYHDQRQVVDSTCKVAGWVILHTTINRTV